MSGDVPIELSISEEAAQAALRRDELSAPDLYEKLDYLTQVYEVIEDRGGAIEESELRDVMLVLNDGEQEIAVGTAIAVLCDLGVIEETAAGLEMVV